MHWIDIYQCEKCRNLIFCAASILFKYVEIVVVVVVAVLSLSLCVVPYNLVAIGKER